MPNGVICGGAVDGSNQLGAMVTCHAMTARPAGTAAAAAAGVAARATTATSNRRVNVRRKPRTWNDVMSTLRVAMVVGAERSGEDGLRLLPVSLAPSRVVNLQKSSPPLPDVAFKWPCSMARRGSVTG